MATLAWIARQVRGEFFGFTAQFRLNALRPAVPPDLILLRQQQVLLVSDNDLLASIIQQQCSYWQMSCTHARNRTEVWAALDGLKPLASIFILYWWTAKWRMDFPPNGCNK